MRTTLKRIKEELPCVGGWETLLKSLGKTKADSEPLSLIDILEANGVGYYRDGSIYICIQSCI